MTPEDAREMARNINGPIVTVDDEARIDRRPQWQPIETAPRNGDTIIVFRRCQGWDVLGYAYWARAGSIEGWIAKGFYEIPGELGLAAPTHWQPLPAPPSLSSPEEG